MISKFMDFIERAQKAQKAVDNLAEQRIKDIETGSHASYNEAVRKLEIAEKKAALAQQKAQYITTNVYDPYSNNAYAQAGTGYYTTTTNTIYRNMGGSGGSGGIGIAIGAGGSAGWVNASPSNHTVSVQLPSGQAENMTIVDADGKEHIIRVDISYLHWISDINYGHRSIIANRPKVLPDPEFDLGEMEKASEILEGLDGSHQ